MDENDPMAFFYEIFDTSLPRLGPGDAHSTKRALAVILSKHSRRADAPDTTKLRVLDIGCGNGASTLELARHVNGTIMAVDNHQPFLDELQRRAEAEGVGDKIELVLGDMHHLEWDEGSFDLIWSEGALYIMGLREGLTACHRLLAPHGLLGISDIVWLRPDPPVECREYFAAECPFMADIDSNRAIMESCGYEILEHFVLPESAWWKPFYEPLENRLQRLRKDYAADTERIEVIESVQAEIELYRNYSSYYGYVFYLMKRR